MSTHHVRSVPVRRVGRVVRFEVPLTGEFAARTRVGGCVVTHDGAAFRSLEVGDGLVAPDVAEAALTVTHEVRLDLADAEVGEWLASADGRLSVGVESATGRVVAFVGRG